jgi:hypothetical protein
MADDDDKHVTYEAVPIATGSPLGEKISAAMDSLCDALSGVDFDMGITALMNLLVRSAIERGVPKEVVLGSVSDVFDFLQRKASERHGGSPNN